jgi:opacity protein-like surface antigen
MRNALCVGVCAAAILATTIAASAADRAVVPPVSSAPLWSWTGVYAGFHSASGWASNTWQSATGPLADPDFEPFFGLGAGNGAVAGGQFGLNYQAGPWVLGAELALSAADINTDTLCGRGKFSCTAVIDGVGTLTGRFGFAFDQFLIYANGGAAAEHAHDQLEAIQVANFAPNTFHGSGTRWGWTTGVGVEFAFNPTLSAIAEYDFLDFGTRDVAVIDQNGIVATVPVSERVHLVKVGLNYKLGQNLSPWVVSAGTVPMFPAPPPASWNWTGVYVGGHVGGGWGQTNWNSSDGVFGSAKTVFPGSGTDNGFAIGGQLGINYQVGLWVMGVEADADWSDLDGNAPCARFPDTVIGGRVFSGPSFACHTRINGLGTLTGRLGQTFGNLLIYGKGGAAWDTESHFALNISAVPNPYFSGNDSRRGWTVGAGLEYAFTPAWSGKIEYDYLSFANETIGFNDGAGNTSNVGMSQNINVVKMGFNYKLGADPTAGAYASAAIPMWVKAPVFKAPPPSDWTIEAGARYWLSTGRKQQDLYDPNTSTQINSRLFFEGATGQAGEAFARLDHRDGMFLKGNFGLGDLNAGLFYDEDFAPGTVPYSITRAQKQRDGRTLYGSLDVGHALVSGPSGDLGAYVGYRYLYERQNMFGDQQLATNMVVGVPPRPPSVPLITETEAWNGLAVGLNTRVSLAERWRLELDGAWLPYLGDRKR